MFRLHVKEVIDEKHISMNKLSMGAKIPLSMVQRLCKDEKYIPSVLTIIKAANYLKVPMESLCVYSEDDTNN